MAPTDVRLLALLVLAASLVVADPPSAMPHVMAARRGAAPGRATPASDLAALRNPVARPKSIMILPYRPKLALDDRAGKYVPEFGRRNKAGIPLRPLLTPAPGPPAEPTLDDYRYGRAEAIRRISA